MKYLICSDIHGSAVACRKIVEQFAVLHCDELILLGDVLYHGPRNPLPEEYKPKEVAGILNGMAEKIIACRGNCDSEVDQMVLNFPIGADYTLTVDDGVRLFASHGHVYSPCVENGTEPVVAGSKLPPLSGCAVELFGHIHVQMLYKTSGGIIVCNPGSPSLPKNSAAGFAMYENKCITLFNLDGSVEKELRF